MHRHLHGGPHISALAGIVRSVNPQPSRDSIKNLIRSSGSHYAAQTSQLGAGLPNARIAVDQAIAQTPNRLTPLFSMYSAERRDYFYTTVPQMAAAASWGTLQPVFIPSESSRYVPATGAGINNYFSFPGGYPFVMRKYNPVRDDHAIFPETALSAMTSQGYTESSGSDWLGYAYPNVTGIVPAIQ